MNPLKSHSHPSKRPLPYEERSGFSLVEMLVAMGIIGILITIITLVWPKIQYRMDSSITTSNLRQILAAATLYANDHNGNFPSTQYGTDQEFGWFRYLIRQGYITDTNILINPTNEREASKAIGQNIDLKNRGNVCYFTHRRTIYTRWKFGPNVDTPTSLYDKNVDVPIVWDQRAENFSSANWANQVTTPDGRYGGHFLYMDGEIRLIGPPEHVVRGQPPLDM